MTREFKAGTLRIKIYDDRQQMGAAAAREVGDRIRGLLLVQQVINMVFAAAPSQNELLANLCREENIDWTKINAFHMDEYAGMDNGNSRSFGFFLRERIFGQLPFREIFYLDGSPPDYGTTCNAYAQLLLQFPTDIVCLGIGENAHIAFNDPHAADFSDPLLVKPVDLDAASRQQQVNDGCFPGLSVVPAHALTLTIPALMRSRYVYGVVPGASKAKAVCHTLYSEIGERFPSTILRTHPNALLFLDPDSSALVTPGRPVQ